MFDDDHLWYPPLDFWRAFYIVAVNTCHNIIYYFTLRLFSLVGLQLCSPGMKIVREGTPLLPTSSLVDLANSHVPKQQSDKQGRESPSPFAYQNRVLKIPPLNTPSKRIQPPEKRTPRNSSYTAPDLQKARMLASSTEMRPDRYSPWTTPPHTCVVLVSS